MKKVILDLQKYYSPIGVVALIGMMEELGTGKFVKLTIEPESKAITNESETIEPEEDELESNAIIENSIPTNREICKMMGLLPKKPSDNFIEVGTSEMIGVLSILFKKVKAIELPITITTTEDGKAFFEKWIAYQCDSITNFINTQGLNPKGLVHYLEGNPLMFPNGHGKKIEGVPAKEAQSLLEAWLQWHLDSNAIKLKDWSYHKDVKTHIDSLTIEMMGFAIKMQKVESPKNGDAGFTFTYNSKTINKSSAGKVFKSPTFKAVQTAIVDLYATILQEQELTPEE